MSKLFSFLSTLQCGYEFTIFIDEYNNIWSCGDNNKGVCGHNSTEKYITSPKQINNLNNIQGISCGMYHTLCCDYNGNVFSFGCNEYGQLGLNKSKDDLAFSSIPQVITLPFITQIACGLHFSICLSKDGELWSFGQNTNGQLGIGNNTSSIKPLIINNLSNIDYIACGGHFCFCKTISNDYYSWGFNNHGQLAQRNTNTLTLPTQCYNIPENTICIKGGLYHVLFLTSYGIVYSCGSNIYGELGHGNFVSLSIPKKVSALPFIKRISCGYKHNLCIDNDNNLWIFGYNEFYQLGLGHITNLTLPLKHKLVNDIIDISYGSYCTFIKTLQNNIYAFGYNSRSQLGISTYERLVKEPIQVLQDNEEIWKTNIQISKAKSARK